MPDAFCKPGPLRQRIRSGCVMARFGRVYYGTLGTDASPAGEKPLLCALAQEIGPYLAKYPHNARCDNRSWQDTLTLYAKTALMANYRCRGAQSSRISPSRGRFPARARIMGEFRHRRAAGAVGMRYRADWGMPELWSKAGWRGCGGAEQGWIRQGESRQRGAAGATDAASTGTGSTCPRSSGGETRFLSHSPIFGALQCAK